MPDATAKPALLTGASGALDRLLVTSLSGVGYSPRILRPVQGVWRADGPALPAQARCGERDDPHRRLLPGAEGHADAVTWLSYPDLSRLVVRCPVTPRVECGVTWGASNTAV